MLKLVLDQSDELLEFHVERWKIAPAVNGNRLVHDQVEPLDLVVGEHRRVAIIVKLVLRHVDLVLDLTLAWGQVGQLA